MGIYKALLATDKPMANGERFTKEALEMITEKSRGIPITLNFDKTIPALGHVLEARLSSEGVEIVANLVNRLPPGPLYVTFGGFVTKSHNEDGAMVFDEVEPIMFGLTATPADSNLRPIKED